MGSLDLELELALALTPPTAALATSNQQQAALVGHLNSETIRWLPIRVGGWPAIADMTDTGDKRAVTTK